MPKKSTVKPKEVKKATEKVGAKVLYVTWSPVSGSGKTTREYSAELHGMKFAEKAEEFAKKKGGTVSKTLN